MVDPAEGLSSKNLASCLGAPDSNQSASGSSLTQTLHSVNLIGFNNPLAVQLDQQRQWIRPSDNLGIYCSEPCRRR
jgi:hypothetical protein